MPRPSFPSLDNHADREPGREVDPITRHNLRTVAEMQAEALRERTLGERVVDALGALVGTVPFWLAHLLVIGGWVAVNIVGQGAARRWDPWPFDTLRVLLSIEATLISCSLLVIQGRMKRLDAQRSHLDLQVSLLAEREATKTLQLLRAICHRLDMEEAHDPELLQLIRVTQADRLQQEVNERLVDP
jgi:uncharacterized membrane protein